MTRFQAPLPLTEASTPGGVSDEYFYRMLSPKALDLSAQYHHEESAILERSLKDNPQVAHMNFVAVGGGELWELRRALTYTASYLCIEPLADIFLNDSIKFLIEQSPRIHCLAKRFGDVEASDLSSKNNFFMFLFNIMSYIEDPIASINKVTKPGDVLQISTWADTSAAIECRRTYFNYLNSFNERAKINPNDRTAICYFDSFPFTELNYFKKVERFQGTFTDILVIYL